MVRSLKPLFLDEIDFQDFNSVKAVAFDFDGVFTDNTVIVDQNGVESVSCWRSDGLGLSRLRLSGIEMTIVSTEINPVVSARAKKLKMTCTQGVDDKAEAIKNWSEFIGIPLNQVCFVGNDINDIPAFKMVGMSIGVADSYEEVYPVVTCLTRKPGGYGAVREICDFLFNYHRQNSGSA